MKKSRYIAHLKNEIKNYFSQNNNFLNISRGFGGGNDVKIKNREGASKNSVATPETFGTFGHESTENKSGKEIKTIYFGGGTPSILSHDELREILECFITPSPLGEGWGEVEITLEANPEDITAEYIRGVFDLGINRLSIGIQTLNDISLKEIHRSSKESIYGALESVEKSLGGKNISVNIDFILGLPYTKKGETLEGIKELHRNFPFITHTSVYMLEQENYPKHWKENSLSEDKIQEEFLEIMEYFETLGWNHYELSNWAKPGYESIHNQSYWNHSDYQGFGLSASSYKNRKRSTNASSFSGYYEGKIENAENLTDEQIEIEKMMFGLRTNGWILPHQSGNQNFGDQSKTLKKLISDGLLEEVIGKVYPTKTGIFLLDHIMSELIS